MKFLHKLRAWVRVLAAKAWEYPIDLPPHVAAAVDATPQTAPPPPACTWCKEPITNDAHPDMRFAHVECAVRMAAGPIAHLEKRCGCYIAGATDTDPPDLSPREAALQVFRHVRTQLHGPPN